MRSTLRIFIFGFLFYSGIGAPADPMKDVPEPKSKTSPSIISPPQVFFATLGQDIELPCEVVNNTDEEAIVWTHNSTVVSADVYFLITDVKDLVLGSKSLILKNFKYSRAGIYNCIVGPTRGGINVTHIVRLEDIGASAHPVKENEPKSKPKTSPSIITQPQVFSATLGQDLELPCVVVNKTHDEIIAWTHNDSFIFVDALLYAKDGSNFALGNKSSLILKNFNRRLAGTYKCLLVASRISVSVSHVVGLEDIAPEPSAVNSSQAENHTKLCCVFEKDREIIWLKNSEHMNITSDRFIEDNGEQKSCITIRTAKVEDVATYTCKSRKAKKTDIIPIGSPDKPSSKQIGNVAGVNKE